MHFPYVDEGSPAVIAVEDGGPAPPLRTTYQDSVRRSGLLTLALQGQPSLQTEDVDTDSDKHSEISWEVISHGSKGAVSPRVLLAKSVQRQQPNFADSEVPETSATLEQSLGAKPANELPEVPDSPHSMADSLDSSAAHELYSLSQEGSIDGVSDSETHRTDDLMAQAEPENRVGFETTSSGSEGGAKPEVVEDGAASEGAAPDSLYATITQELAQLSGRVKTFVAAGVAAASEMATHVCGLLQDWLETVKARLHCVAVPPLRMLGEEVADAGQHVRRIVDRVLRTSKAGPIDWTKVLLGAGCIALAAVCYSLRTSNQKLTLKLAKRDAELAELVGRIMNLRHRSSSVPIIRPASCATLAPWAHLINAV